MGRITLFPTVMSKNTSVCGTTPAEHILNARGRIQTFKKANILLIMKQCKTQEIKETKDLEEGPKPQGGSCEGGEISTHSETPSQAEMRGWGQLWNLKDE